VPIVEGVHVATSRQIDSIPVEHPVLGTAVEIYADRRQALGSTFVYLAFVTIGILGLVLGQSDLSSGSTVLGLAELAGGVILGLYSIRAALTAARRYRNPLTLVVGTGGFEYVGGKGPVGWDEVAAVSDPASRPGRQATLKVQLNDPGDYVVRHALSPVARVMLRVNHNDLVIARDAVIPVEAAQDLMRKRLAGSRPVAHDESAAPPARALRQPRPLRRPRPSPKG
jgi:hypothetical protein